MSGIDLKPMEEVLQRSKSVTQNEEEEMPKVLIAEAKTFNPAYLVSTFGIASSASFLLSYIYLKN